MARGEAEKLPGISNAQLELMNIVWERGEASVTDVWQGLPEGRRLARTTVMTVLARLAEKGWLKRSKRKNEIFYAPAVAKEAALKGLVGRLLDAAFAGSLAKLVMTLVDVRGISSEEAAHLRQIIDGSAKGGKP